MERNHKIYCYTNLVTGKICYVGQTNGTLEVRARKDGSGYKSCFVFWNAICKYGWSNFKGEILEDGLTLEEANEREQYWISELNTLSPNGYNLQIGGLNHGMHEDTRQRISRSNKGKIFTEEHKKRIKESRKNQVFTDETRKKMSESHRGLHHSTDSIQKMSDNRDDKRPVLQFSFQMEYIGEFPSIMEASRMMGINRVTIYKVAQGKRKSAGGYIWKYKGVA